MKVLIRLWHRLVHRYRIGRAINRVKALDVASSGVDDEGHAWVRLEGGLIFYGFPSGASVRRYYRKVNKSTGGGLCVDALQVALDIVVRYEDGALKLGGPLKQRNYVVKDGDCAVEMGAYLGHYTMRLAEQVGPGGGVVAIEANPYNHAILDKNINENGFSQVRIVKSAVWNRAQSVSLSIREQDNQSTSIVLRRPREEVVAVSAERLDGILERARVQNIALMIIQLNGAEPEALEGLSSTWPDHFAIASRYSVVGKRTLGRICACLEEHGYRLDVVDREFVYADIR